jgi:hypothetical protein
MVVLTARSACAAAPPPIDCIIFGNPANEQNHHLSADHSDVVVGGLGESARRLLPLEPNDWQGGAVSFAMRVDPVKPNYFTIRLWGSDRTSDRLILFCQGKQVGYRYLGDVDILDDANGSPGFAGRFFYTTTPLPVEMTRGKTEVHLEIQSNGRMWGYGTTWEQYQRAMTEPSRGVYSVYTHTDGCFVPPLAEKQGPAITAPPVRKEPGNEVLDQLKTRVANEISRTMATRTPLNQMRIQFLAKAYHLNWSPAYHNEAVVQLVIAGADDYYAQFKQNAHLAEADAINEVYNAGWLGLGPLGDAVRLLRKPLQASLDQTIDDGNGKRIARRKAWSAILQASRDWHLQNRRQYTNQTMINDLFAYVANRGVAAVDPAHALSEKKIRHYLYESIGLEPWLGSDTDHGPARSLGNDYWQLTSKGLTRELGFVGYYGEVLDWTTSIYLATSEPEQPGSGDPIIKTQLEKIQKARSYFRYPEVDDDGYHAMRAETVVGWRDEGHYPGEVTYAERSTLDASTLYEAAATLSPSAVGAAQQMFADNQFFATLAERLREQGLRATSGCMSTPDQYELLKSLPPSAGRLPMSVGQPDFAWADEQDGVLAVKHGDQILYASLYWRARYGINNLARVHWITPRVDHIAVVWQESEFVPSGMEYTRQDWVNTAFAGGGLQYPGNLHSALAGEKLPIAKIPAGVNFRPGDESPFAGRASFYRLRYGDFLIGMNCTRDKTYNLRVDAGVKNARDLISGRILSLAWPVVVKPQTTVVLYLGN